MPWLARIVIPGLPHHVTQRGSNRQGVFSVDDERAVYLGPVRIGRPRDNTEPAAP